MAKITKEMIARILAHVGGAANVAQAGNCMTRLRLTLRDESLADSAAIRQIDGVMGVIVSDEQFQVVLGPGKAQTAAEMMNGLLEEAPAAPSLADVAAEKKQALKGKQTSAVQKFLAKFRHHLYAADPRLYRRRAAAGLRHPGGTGFRAGERPSERQPGSADWLYEGLQQRDVHLPEYPDWL
ncbi:PTS transporter subunit EIIB [Klebsiella variicola subsp. variicola]|nr:PTS transporter subunit EIIB [Klebsiella variicola subsp. variicola]